MDHGPGIASDRPYFDDPYTTAFEATIAAEREDARGRWEAGLEVEETAFAPLVLRELVTEAGADLHPLDLRCPQADDLYPYRGRDRDELTSGVDAGYLVLWDREPHADRSGSTSYRGLRRDGRVEVLCATAK